MKQLPISQSADEHNVGMVRCSNLPNDAEDGHYWIWHHNPQSNPVNLS